ncbi:MAG: flavodoxin family protein [bacterium]|nr:flavodoxin family protein [bacterium]
MNILILMGSPRANENTAALARAFESAAKEKGHTVNYMDIGKKNIRGCLSCEYCHGKGEGKCIQHDDMQAVYEALERADTIVFASPIYYFTMSAQMESVIQRFYAIGKPKAKRAILLLSSASNNVYTAATAQFKEMLGYMGIENAGIITAYGRENKSDAKIAEVKELAASL